MAKFDWYRTTVQVMEPSESGLLSALESAWPLADLGPSRAQHGYSRGAAFRFPGGDDLCTLWWGGNPWLCCEARSSQAPLLASAVQSLGVIHRPSRVDVCEDWDEPGLFDRVAPALIEFAKANRVSLSFVGDWARGKARTLYLGSRASVASMRLYEKGYEMGCEQNPAISPNWVRLEVEVKPKRDREQVASWHPGEFLTVGWIPAALASIGWDHLAKRSLGTVWKQYDYDRVTSAMVGQYGRHLRTMLEQCGGWQEVGELLGQLISEREAEKLEIGKHRKSRENNDNALLDASVYFLQ